MRTHTLSMALVCVTLGTVTCFGEETSPAYEHLKVLEPMVGESTGTWSSGDFKIENAKRVWKWGEGKGCILWNDEYRLTKEQAENSNLPRVVVLNGIIGWDPVREQITLDWHSNWGLSGSERLNVDENRLTGVAEHKFVGGEVRIAQRRVTMEISPEGKLTVKSVNLGNDSMHQAEWTRKK